MKPDGKDAVFGIVVGIAMTIAGAVLLVQRGYHHVRRLLQLRKS